MDREKTDFMIKRYQLEHLVPLALTIISIYFWFFNFQQNIIYFIGLLINIIGLFIWWSAKITLAENWDGGYGQPKIKKIVTNGIYSKICHPLYWGINITLIGMSLIYLNIYLIAVSIIIIFYFFYRMKVENKFLTKKLGEKYLDYKKSVWF
ncbi:isoprenylcysteine carboxylmethyltransferase family protein [bacterium]|nr:isoprenylcysteine carboxylmethyltransferase family protein [bacterium]